jgi:hypothetical protein
METSVGQAFSENTGELISRGDERDGDIFIEHFFKNKVIVHFNVFGAGVVNRIRG